MPSKKGVIIIVPCYNEQDSIPHLLPALQDIRTKLSKNYNIDILFINDGSSDNTHTLIRELACKFEYIYYRSFAGNAGHQSAVRAGINAAKGYDAAIMMDADMQHPPKFLPQMIEAWEKGALIVQMVRQDTSRDVGFFKFVTSRGYYQFMNKISDLHMEYGISDFRLIDKVVVQTVINSPENNLFLRGYFSWLSVPKTVIEYIPDKRIAGTSKYTLKKMLQLAYHGMVQFSEKPLRIATAMGGTLAVLSFLYGLILVARYFITNNVVSGWTSLMVTMLFCFGITFMLIGAVGLYLAHAIQLQKQRPEYIIADEKLPFRH